ncbi:MAG: hypothetical protein SFU86_24290 [Pirellulaceae bacterium]|nr:hypothetical protein [Pirellulaceae bacterium]
MNGSELAEATRAALAPRILTLRIIVVALALGVLSFALVSIQLNASKPQLVGQQLSIPFLVLGLGAIPAGMLLPALIFRSAMQALAKRISPDESASEIDLASAILGNLQTSTIIGCAFYEGGAFANLVQYMTAVELVHLGLAFMLLLLILTRFPWPGRVEEIIAGEIRRLKEEAGLRREP